MPFTFNGIGTILYGARDFRPNGSHVATEWFALIYIPVLPLKSMRIIPAGNNKSYAFYNSSRYVILEKTKLNPRQVLSVYAFFTIFTGSFLLASATELWWLALPGVAVLVAPWFLRRRAIERSKGTYAHSSAASTSRVRPSNESRSASGNAFCTKCGVAFPASALFCGACGTRRG